MVEVDVDSPGTEFCPALVASSVLEQAVSARLSARAVASGARLLLARSDDPMQNGGLPKVDALFDFDLTQTGSVVLTVAPLFASVAQ